MGGLRLFYYLDVNGVDYTGQVFSINSNPKLSDVGLCDIVLSNKGGQYKSSFSKMQRVAVSQARAAFNAQSDYFTGVDAAAPNATRWAVSVSDANCYVRIYSNKLQCYVVGNTKYAKAVGQITISQPYSIFVYAISDSVDANASEIDYRFSSGGNDYWAVLATGGSWRLYTRQSGVFAQRATGGTHVINAWYRILMQQTSATSVTLTIQDVYGGTLWTSGAIVVDSVSSGTITVGVNTWANISFTTKYDSFLCWNETTPKGQQTFEGVIDAIEFSLSPSTITLHCVDDLAELERQYDDTYGTGDSTYSSSYGTTNDMLIIIAALLPSDWTYAVDASGVHDVYKFPQGSTRLQCLKQVIQNSPFLGFYVLPMKHLVCMPPDFAYTVDAYTESDAANWVLDTSTAKTDDANINVHGSNSFKQTKEPMGDTSSYRAVNFGPVSSYSFISLYWGGDNVGNGCYLRIYTDTATPKYWEILLPSYSTAVATEHDLVHTELRLPDSDGNHGWTPTNSPSVASNIVRIRVRIYGVSQFSWTDSLNVYSNKKLTSKYTLSNIIAATREIRKTPYNKISVVRSGGTDTAEDTTLQTVDGLQQLVYPDLNIAAIDGIGVARAILNHISVVQYEPIQVVVVNPGDMYNVMLGDTVTLTVADANLSSATRMVTERQDVLNGKQGWQTTLTLSQGVQPRTASQVYQLLNLKRR